MRLFLLSVVVLCISSLAAHADTVYTYTGQNLVYVRDPYTTSDRVTGSFAVTSALGSNLSDYTFDPEAFTFSDGVQTLSNNDLISKKNFTVTTDSAGAITFFYILLDNQTSFFTLRNDPFNHQDTVGSYGGSGYNNTAGSFSTPATVTPEPSSIALLGTGLLGVAGVLRKRFV